MDKEYIITKKQLGKMDYMQIQLKQFKKSLEMKPIMM